MAMEQSISRSEKKRLAKGIELLAQELVVLSEANIRRLPCDPAIQNELVRARTLKGGAQKRLIKYIAKELREISTDELLIFLEQKKGSKLKRNQKFHELERLRDAIITEAITDHRQIQQEGGKLDHHWESETIAQAETMLPDLDTVAIKKSALRYAVTRKPVHSREIFRVLKAARERLQFISSQEKHDGI